MSLSGSSASRKSSWAMARLAIWSSMGVPMKRFFALCVGLLVLGGLGHYEAYGQKKKDGDVAVPKLEEIPGLIKQLGDKDAKKRAQAAASLGARGQLRARDIKEAVEKLEKDKKMSEDDRKRAIDELDKLTHSETSKIEGFLALKEKELMQI